MENINPQRALLAIGYKKAVQSLIDTQGLLLGIIKDVSSIKEQSKFTEQALEALRGTTKQISEVLSKSSNKELGSGLLFQLNSQISKDWLDTGGVKDTKGYVLRQLAENLYVDEKYVNSRIKRIENNVEKTFNYLEEGHKSKGVFSEAIKSSDLKGLLSGSLNIVENILPGGNILKHLGNFAYSTWDKQNKASFNKNAPRFQGNLQGYFGEDAYSDFNAGGFNEQGTGGTTGGGGGFAGGVQSGVNFDPGSNRFRGQGGRYISNAAGVAGLNSDPLFVFFNRNAYTAGWTRDVLKLLKDISGTETEGQGLGASVKKGIGEGLGIGADLGVSALGGRMFAKAKGLASKVKGLFGIGRGAAAVGEGAVIGEEVAGGAAVAEVAAGTGLAGLMGFLPALIPLVIGGLALWGIPKIVESINKSHREKATESPIKFTDSQSSTVAVVAVLNQILAETKKQNVQADKKDHSSSGYSSTSRPVHRDIGDTTTELLNLSVVGQPRR